MMQNSALRSSRLCSSRHCPEQVHYALKYSLPICFVLILASCLILPSSALPDEVMGQVINVISGDSLGIQMLIGDSRTRAIDSIKLADIEAPSTVTQKGKAAKEYVYSLLKNKTVYLDIDNSTSTGRNEWSQLICVIYLMDDDFRPVWPPVNRMIVDAGQAQINNDTSNEFNPSSWWEEPPTDLSGRIRSHLKSIQQDQWDSSGSATGSVQELEAATVTDESQKTSVLDTGPSGQVSIGYRR